MNDALHPTAVDLGNCDREPIHAPGSIQPHGALLAFTSDGRLVSSSANARDWVGALPGLGEEPGPQHFTADIRAALSTAMLAPGESDTFEVSLASGRAADLSAHFSGGLLIAEFEPRATSAPARDKFAPDALRALERIQQQDSLPRLLEVATEEIARLSGFDRAMAYRFHHDGSGEVVAERMRKPLEPYIGLRYPASDIPAQARRLYTLNPLRLIVDMQYRAVPLAPDLNPLTNGPIDLSFSVLRSVSPIHVEYLTNMGVRASMSVSIVVQGKLWGLFACHHYSPHLVPYSVRMSCQLLSKMVSVLVERVLATSHARTITHAARVRGKIADRAQLDEDIVHALVTGDPGIADLAKCAGVAVSSASRIVAIADVPARARLAEVVEWLNQRASGDLIASDHLREDFPELAGACDGYAGMAAIRFSPEPNSYVMWFRREEIDAVRWAGRPDKVSVQGPNGPRLTPRGSFAEWKQVVHGRSAPWEEAERETLEEFRRSLREIAALKMQEEVRTRETMLAMLGHDLRNPLQAITMAGEMLRLDGSQAPRVQKQIASSTGRMSRLISHVLEVSRLQAGLGLNLDLKRLELSVLLEELIAESRAAYPGTEIHADVAAAGEALVDSDRIAQVISNLLSNARQHGPAGKEIRIVAGREAGDSVIRVTNYGQPLSEVAMKSLFEPFKRASLGNPNNPSGMGLGLYIVASIVREHGGGIAAQSRDGLVTFTVTLPGTSGRPRPSAP